MQRSKASCGNTAVSIATLNGADAALKVGGMEELRQLQEAMAHHKHLRDRQEDRDRDRDRDTDTDTDTDRESSNFKK